MFERFKKARQEKRDRAVEYAAFRRSNQFTLTVLRSAGYHGALVTYKGKTYAARVDEQLGCIVMWKRYGMGKSFSSNSELFYFREDEDGVMITTDHPHSYHFGHNQVQIDPHYDQEEADEVFRLCHEIELLSGEVKIVGQYLGIDLMDYIQNCYVFDVEKDSFRWGFNENNAMVYVPFHAIKKYNRVIVSKGWIERNKEEEMAK